MVPAEWITIGDNPSSPFGSMDITIPKIYLTPGDPESINRQLELSCFNFTNKITLQDGQTTLYVYEGTCFPTSMLGTLQGTANPGNSLLEAIHTAYTSNGQDMKKSYVIFEVRLDTINVYWNLVAAF